MNYFLAAISSSLVARMILPSRPAFRAAPRQHTLRCFSNFDHQPFAQYGERVLAEPQRKGFTSLVWVLPVISVLLGLVVVWQVLKGWRGSQSQASSLPPPLTQVDPHILAKIEQELQELD